MLTNTPDTLTLKDLMKVLHIGKGKALELIHSKVIEAHRIAGKWLICRDVVEEYILRS